MNEDQHGGTDDGFTMEQQDVYYHEDRCPYCRSEELLFASWENRERGRSKVREVFCDDCEEEWVEVYCRVAHCGFLLKPGVVEDYFNDEGDLEGNGSDDDTEEDDTEDESEGADADITGASTDGPDEASWHVPQPRQRSDGRYE